jgi:hypothetical protein
MRKGHTCFDLESWLKDELEMARKEVLTAAALGLDPFDAIDARMEEVRENYLLASGSQSFSYHPKGCPGCAWEEKIATIDAMNIVFEKRREKKRKALSGNG